MSSHFVFWPIIVSRLAAAWGRAINGPLIIIGTDENFHDSQSDYVGRRASTAWARFAVSDRTKTGGYISLSCYYHDVAPLTNPTFLNAAFYDTGLVSRPFLVTGVGCFNDVHIVANHSALTGLTDAVLSGWECSVHDAFMDFDLQFEVLAIAVTGSVFRASDGTTGTPYVIARGVQVISDITLTSSSSQTSTGNKASFFAEVKVNGIPQAGLAISFTVVGGPHAGVTGADITNALGIASFSYIGKSSGIDFVMAMSVSTYGQIQRSNKVIFTWTVGPTSTTLMGTNSTSTLYYPSTVATTITTRAASTKVALPQRLFDPSLTAIWSSAGMDIVQLTDSEWLGLTQEKLTQYAAIVIPDNFCKSDPSFVEFLFQNGLFLALW